MPTSRNSTTTQDSLFRSGLLRGGCHRLVGANQFANVSDANPLRAERPTRKGWPPLRSLLFAICGLFALCSRAADVVNQPAGFDQIELHPEFRIERVAAEPVVMDPVDLQFDLQGRAFVVEMGGYPFASEIEAEFPGKVALIEDTNNDGVYDKRTVFADRLQYANAILPYRDGILVASPPDLLLLKDTDGDNRADVREVLISGFAVGNSQHNFNGLILGLDNWVYAGNGGNSGEIFWPDRPDVKFPLLHRDMKFDLVNKRIEFIGRTTTGFAVALDDWGRVFTTHNLRHINHLVFPNRYLDPHPQLVPKPNPDISDHKTGHLDRAYPIGKQEARLNHPEQSGYFSCSCGITFYGGGAFGEEFNGNLFVADSVMNLVHRDVVRPDGPSFLAARGRPKTEFLASADRHSRPVNMRVGPDGALYVVDMYRVVIEHPEWIPDEIEKDMDLYAGTNQGRIYRVTPRKGLPRTEPQFDRDDPESVVGYLGHANKWWRDMAQHLLVWWNDARSMPLLDSLAFQSSNPKARVHALWTLRGLRPNSVDDGIGALKPEHVRAALADPHPGVRENALALSEPLLSGSPELLNQVLTLGADPDARVRMQVALSLGTVDWAEEEAVRGKFIATLLQILRRDSAYEWSRFAVVSCAAQAPLPVLWAFLDELNRSPGRTAEDQEGVVGVLRELSELVGAQGATAELRELLAGLSRRSRLDEAHAMALLTGVNSGLGRGNFRALAASDREAVEGSLRRLETRDSVGLLTQVWGIRERLALPVGSEQRRVLMQAHAIVSDREVDAGRRLSYLRLLGFASFDQRRDLLFALLDFREPKSLQLGAIDQLARQRDPSVADQLIDQWRTLSREVRSRASDYLIYRSWNHDLLLTALEEDRLKMGQLNLDLERRRRLLRSNDPSIRARAEALFTDAGIVTRGEVLRNLLPATSLVGDPEKGRVHYENLCLTCHTMGDTGFAVGPDLTEISRKGAETLLSDMFDPNAAVNAEYLNYTIEDTEDEVYSGIIINETEAMVGLRAAGGVEYSIARDRILDMSSSGLSLMPEGLEFGLSHQDVADLLAYLQEPK